MPRLPTYGPGTELYPDRLQAAGQELILDAGVLAAAGPSLPDVGLEPLYLRRPDAAEPSRPEVGAGDPAAAVTVTAVISRPARRSLPAIMDLEQAGFDPGERWSESSWRDELAGEADRHV